MLKRFSNKRVYLGQFYRAHIYRAHKAPLRLAYAKSASRPHRRRWHGRHDNRLVWQIVAWAFALAVLVALAGFGGVGLQQPNHLPVGMVLNG